MLYVKLSAIVFLLRNAIVLKKSIEMEIFEF